MNKRGDLHKKLLVLFLVSIALSVIYYFVLSTLFYWGKDLKLKNEIDSLNSYLAENEDKIETLHGALLSLEHRDRNIYKSIFGSYPIDVEQDNDKEYSEVELNSVIAEAAEVSSHIDTIFASLEYLGNSATNIPSKVPLIEFSIEQIGASQGKKINPFYKSVTAHNGLDIVAALHSEVIAPADGVVESVSEKEERGRGNVLTIDHLNGYKTRYTNLHSISVRKGQKVKQGSVIAKVGSTGMSLAPHLHYEVIFKGRYMNPIHYLFADINHYDYNTVVTISENTGQSLD